MRIFFAGMIKLWNKFLGFLICWITFILSLGSNMRLSCQPDLKNTLGNFLNGSRLKLSWKRLWTNLEGSTGSTKETELFMDLKLMWNWWMCSRDGTNAALFSLISSCLWDLTCSIERDRPAKKNIKSRKFRFKNKIYRKRRVKIWICRI